MTLSNEGEMLSILRSLTFKKLTYGLVTLASIYILGPSISHVLSTLFGSKRIAEDRSNKRLDKYTTGLTNRSTECYINSSLQALSSLQNLSISLNEYIDLTQSFNDNTDPIDTPRVLVHESLSELLSDLQELILYPRTLSNKPVVQTLERIFQGRLSRDQNDAHEFVQILLERLYEEYKMLSNSLKEHSSLTFPFKGEISSHYFCMKCHKRSEIIKQDQLIWELNVPQKYNCTLNEMIEGSESEIIEDYSCLYCQVSALLANEASDNFNNTEIEKENIQILKSLLPTLKINSDIPNKLVYFISNYNKNRCVPSRIKTTIAKRTFFSSSPNSLVIHLSRSVYNGMVMTRNSCRVSFPEDLEINEQQIDENDSVQTRKVRYVLRSMVKHTGTHYQGHYQCYRHKPDLLVDPKTKETINNTLIIKARSICKNKKTEPKPLTQSKKYKKVKSIKSFPFWHISDETVKEVKSSSLQNQNKHVYMLYYERL